ncbi:hypothetical protein [Ramlibacter sp. PS4R-6]|uniref:hypothetical protein n=1 Tax=Ramlibacter sp. PS4R-6 TaxID=3133438 RepID=UPI0030A5C663
MEATVTDRAATPAASRYAKAIEASKRVRWDIDRDVIRGREFDYGRKFLPDGLSKVQALTFLSPAEKRLLSQVQGRTYANMFALVERFIGAKTAELSRDHSLGDQVAFEALVRLTDEELKHQELFRRLDAMMTAGMPAGYTFLPEPNEVAKVVLGKGDWAIMALTLDIEIFSQSHYRSSIDPDAELSPLWKDVFLFHWKEESQHAILDELEWRRVHAMTSPAGRDRGVDELIELVGAVDGICQAQAGADADYFIANAGRKFTAAQEKDIRDTVLKAYRWQYILSGAQDARYGEVLQALTTPEQLQRVLKALGPIAEHVGQ